jgi:hypothetical protein
MLKKTEPLGAHACKQRCGGSSSSDLQMGLLFLTMILKDILPHTWMGIEVMSHGRIFRTPDRCGSFLLKHENILFF